MSDSPGIVTNKLLQFDPDAIALVDLAVGESVTYNELIQKIFEFRHAMRNIADSRNGPIAIQMHRCLGSIFGMLAGADEGLTLVPIDPRQPDSRTAAVIEQSQVVGMVDPLSEKTFFRAQAAASTRTIEFPQGPMFFTSGTTGLPKGVSHTWANLTSNAESFIEASRIDASANMLHVFPLYYMAGFLNTVLVPLFAGARVVLADQFGPRSGATFREDVQRGTATTAWLSPTMAESIRRLDRGRGKLGEKFDFTFCGTGRLDPASREAFELRFDCTLINSYGTSELLILTLGERGGFRDTRVAGVGRPLPGVEMIQSRIHAEQDEAESEILVRVPWAAVGYVQGDKVTPLETAQGHIRTRDFGRMVEDQVHVYGRIDGVVVKGGVNVYPEPIEDIALRQDGVIAAGLVGIPHVYWGAEPILAVEAGPGIDGDSLTKTLVNRLRFDVSVDQLPARILVLKEIPKSASGKVSRKELTSIVRDMM